MYEIISQVLIWETSQLSLPFLFLIFNVEALFIYFGFWRQNISVWPYCHYHAWHCFRCTGLSVEVVNEAGVGRWNR